MSKVTIRVRADGPYKVTGDFTLTDHEGNVIETGDDIVLCRCGHSNTKPFCDRTHKEIGFKS